MSVDITSKEDYIHAPCICHHDSHVLDVPFLPPLHGDECQAAQGQCGDGLQQVGHQPGWGPHQGGVC